MPTNRRLESQQKKTLKSLEIVGLYPMIIPVRYPMKPIKYVGEIPTLHVFHIFSRPIFLKEVRPWQLRLCLRDKQSPVELWKNPLVYCSYIHAIYYIRGNTKGNTIYMLYTIYGGIPRGILYTCYILHTGEYQGEYYIHAIYYIRGNTKGNTIYMLYTIYGGEYNEK